jgi:hypothetical protein
MDRTPKTNRPTQQIISGSASIGIERASPEPDDFSRYEAAVQINFHDATIPVGSEL